MCSVREREPSDLPGAQFISHLFHSVSKETFGNVVLDIKIFNAFLQNQRGFFFSRNVYVVVIKVLSCDQ